MYNVQKIRLGRLLAQCMPAMHKIDVFKLLPPEEYQMSLNLNPAFSRARSRLDQVRHGSGSTTSLLHDTFLNEVFENDEGRAEDFSIISDICRKLAQSHAGTAIPWIWHFHQAQCRTAPQKQALRQHLGLAFEEHFRNQPHNILFSLADMSGLCRDDSEASAWAEQQLQRYVMRFAHFDPVQKHRRSETLKATQARLAHSGALTGELGLCLRTAQESLKTPAPAAVVKN